MRILLIYGILALAIGLFVRMFMALRTTRAQTASARLQFRSRASREVWVQVYDTDSLGEAQGLRAKLQEEELECLVYEQGRKDVHGNVLNGFGIAVPRSSVPLAQKIIAPRIT